MNDPRQMIDADDPVIGDLLAATLELVAEAGGWVNPHARLVARDGQLSIECDDEGEEYEPLLRVPRAVWVRVDRVTWANASGRLAVEDVPDDIGDLEQQMLYLQVALHNQCERLGWLARTHPSLAADVPATLVEAVRRFVPSFRMAQADPIDVLFANRCFRIPLDDVGRDERVLLPVVDLLNHHRAGATGTRDRQVFRVDTSRPFGTDECALDYGLDRDALEMAVVYGFADASARAAHSAPVVVETPSTGRIRVLGSGRSAGGALLPVQAVTSDEGGLDLTRLAFTGGSGRSAADQLRVATGWNETKVEAAVRAIAEANLDLLTDLTESAAGAEDSAAATTLVEAAGIQRAVLVSSVLD